MKFAARDGSAARTLAITKLPSAAPVRVSSGWNPQQSRSVSGKVENSSRYRSDDNGSPRRPKASSPSTIDFARGEEIFTPGNGEGFVYIVRSGCVRLFKVLPDGRSVNLGLLGPGNVFTQEETADGIASGAIAEAMVDSTLSVVEMDALAAVIAESPELSVAAVNGMSRRLTELQTLIEHLLVRDTSIRLATTLIGLANRFGRPTADGMIAITLPLTHQSLANMIGSNRVTVTRKLLELQELGHVRSLGRNALAVCPAKLREYAAAANDSDR